MYSLHGNCLTNPAKRKTKAAVHDIKTNKVNRFLSGLTNLLSLIKMRYGCSNTILVLTNLLCFSLKAVESRKLRVIFKRISKTKNVKNEK
jgi:hypothetical protein